MTFLSSAVADGCVVGSRRAVEGCLTAERIEARAKVKDRSAGRTRCIVEDCLAVTNAVDAGRGEVVNVHPSAGRSRCVVEDYLASCAGSEALQNAAIVGDASATNNQFASNARGTRRDV